ncbi:uncharacterized protein LOC133298163 [Gastrolobium bilobum]|uniref:uncharacterized protein LOC133298163 n=1 Tax=Gastrolobium bilobum TaxID=150636 RepID=UPI002AAFE13C|nr:uncharacterized protein LOC133298163 [Gastrolobium bilobum]
MANLRKPSKEKDMVGMFKPNGRCKKHPKHHQSPGVCSLCLMDKLSQLSASNYSRKTTTSGYSSCSSSASSLSSYYSSSSASSCASPMHPFPFSNEGKSGSSVSIFLMSSKHGGLFKSRSMAVVPRRRRRRKDGEGEDEGGVDNHNKKSAKKTGFWYKLLHPKSKRMEEKRTELVRTRSLRETVNVAS